MQSGSLNCNATNCFHNYNSECKAGAINVGGKGATSISGTGCTTFVDKAKSSFVNSVDDLTTDTCNIKCEVSNCIHNENKGCHAENVQIDVHDAHCKTFECE